MTTPNNEPAVTNGEAELTGSLSLIGNLSVKGNVGIGTTSPETKLDVQGIIRTYNKDTSRATWDNIQIWSDGTHGHIESNGDEDGLRIKSNTAGKIILDSDVEVKGTLKLNSGVAVNEFSNDENLGNSDSAVPTQKAVKTYVDNKIADEKINVLESKINELESEINDLKSKINKSVQIVKSDIQHCPGDSTKSSRFTVSGGTILSIGFQNMHDVRHFYASQMFVLSATQAYIQVNNTDSRDIDYVVVLMVATGIEDTEVKIEILPS